MTRTTLAKVEKGDPGRPVGAYATVLFVLGLVDRLAAADPGQDRIGLALEEERLPEASGYQGPNRRKMQADGGRISGLCRSGSAPHPVGRMWGRRP